MIPNYKDYSERIWRYLFLFLPYALIFSVKISNGIIFTVCTIALIDFFSRNELVFDKLKFAFASTIFVFSLIGLLYTGNLNKGLSIIETRIPIIVFPLVLSLKKVTKELMIAFLRQFIYSLAVTFSLLLIIAVYRNFKDPGPYSWFNKWFYHYSDLTAPINIDPLYLSLFTGFGFLILLIENIGLTEFNYFKSRKIEYLALTILSFFLVILGVRSILLIIMILVILLLIIRRRQNKKENVIRVLLIGIGMVSLILLSPVTRERFKGLYTQEYSFSNYSIDRFIIWSVAIDHVKANPLEFIFGGGTGNSEQLMARLYKKNKIDWAFEQKTNTHNQYLEFLLDTGFIGTSIFVGFLFLSFLKFKGNRQNILGYVFIIFMMLAMINENYLNRQKGVVFFSLFYSLFYFADTRHPSHGR